MVTARHPLSVVSSCHAFTAVRTSLAARSRATAAGLRLRGAPCRRCGVRQRSGDGAEMRALLRRATPGWERGRPGSPGSSAGAGRTGPARRQQRPAEQHHRTLPRAATSVDPAGQVGEHVQLTAGRSGGSVSKPRCGRPARAIGSTIGSPSVLDPAGWSATAGRERATRRPCRPGSRPSPTPIPGARRRRRLSAPGGSAPPIRQSQDARPAGTPPLPSSGDDGDLRRRSARPAPG